MTGILIQQESHMPTSVMAMKQPQERLEIPGSLMLSGQEQAIARPQVHRPEDHTPGVLAANGDVPILPPQRPTGPQRWEQQQVRLVLGQEHAPGPQAAYLPADPSFFSPTPGPGPGGSAPASRRSPADATLGARCPRRTLARRSAATAPARAGRSNHWRNSPSDWARTPAVSATGPRVPRSTDSGGRCRSGPPRPTRLFGAGSDRSSYRYFER